MAQESVNTWPPLVSGTSKDEAFRKQLYGKEVIASVLVEATQDDEFFFPVDGVLSGFNSSGVLYQNGAQVPGAPRASWATEVFGPTRGSKIEFPRRAVVLATDAGVSILDLENRYAMWMLFLRGDKLAYTHNFSGGILGHKPDAVGYQNGRVFLRMLPDAGSDIQAAAFLIIDFTLDQIYMDRAAYTLPAPTGYTTSPAVYQVGVPVVNAPVVNLALGSRPLSWTIWPTLPAGLELNRLTGAITGTPTTPSPLTTYSIQAVNPAGATGVALDLTVLP